MKTSEYDLTEADRIQGRSVSILSESWDEWIKKWRNPEASLEDLIALLHRGFDVAFSGKQCQECTILYLEIAAALRCGISDRVLFVLASKAFSVLSIKVFKGRGRGKSAEDVWLEDPLDNAPVFEALMQFLSRNAVLVTLPDNDYWNVHISKHEKVECVQFLINLYGRRVWEVSVQDYIPHAYAHNDPSDLRSARKKYNAVRAMRPFAIRVLAGLGQLDLLYARVDKLTRPTLQVLEIFASNFAPSPDDLKAESLPDAVRLGSTAAQLLVLSRQTVRPFLAKKYRHERVSIKEEKALMKKEELKAAERMRLKGSR